MKTFLILSFLILNVAAAAQVGCNCTGLSENDKAASTVQRLIASSEAGCRAIGYELLAEDMLRKKELDSAALYLENSLSNYKKTSCAERRYLNVYKLFAQLSDNKVDFQSSLDYNLKALPIAEKADLPMEQAGILLNIAQVFNRLKQVEKGIQYTRLSIPIVAKLLPSVTKAELLNRITARYFFYSQDFKDSKYADTAEVFVNHALEVSKEVKNVKEQIIALTRMNAIYESRGEYKKALGYIDDALKMCVAGVYNRQLTTLYGDKGNLLMNLGNSKEARQFADSCLLYCVIEKYPPLIANAYSLIYEIENKAGNYKEAIWALNNEKKISDSLSSTERTKAVNELEKKYNQAKNEKTIGELAQQKKIYLLLAITGLLALIAIGFFIRQQSLKHKQKILETEQRLNRARMNPHFFFNALSTLHSFAIREKDTDIIASNLSKFSHIMRKTLESTYKEYVTVEQEIDFLNEYLNVQKIRFPKKFSYEVIANEKMGTDEIIIPSMIIQPFVENSIEHGFSGIDYPGYIKILFTVLNKNLQIEITDNGKGLVKNVKEKNEHISRASQIVKDRIYLLNAKLKTKASFSIDNATDNKGVIVKINLPLLYINDIKIEG